MTIYRFPMPSLMTPMLPTVLQQQTRPNGDDTPQRSWLRDDVERVLNAAPAFFGSQELMNADARESATGFTLELDLPGVSPEALDVLAEEGVLLIRATRAERALTEGERQVIAERRFGDIERRFRLPKSADQSNIRAEFVHGVLTVHIAKLAPAQPRRVTVAVGQAAPDAPVAQDVTA
ncbi:MAG: Hsp20/alpha crystallin family protein [Gemmatimonadaceae bacterium]|nr:Hsp20/alpha crystallin family protein [Gemmatimonadaceae bacterium]